MMGSSGITRPRRFGKTLFMDALNAFLSVDFDRARQQAWFKGLKIAEEKVFCAKFMGQFAVIFLSLPVGISELRPQACHGGKKA